MDALRETIMTVVRPVMDATGFPFTLSVYLIGTPLGLLIASDFLIRDREFRGNYTLAGLTFILTAFAADYGTKSVGFVQYLNNKLSSGSSLIMFFTILALFFVVGKLKDSLPGKVEAVNFLKSL